jgi:hypothetical protein
MFDESGEYRFYCLPKDGAEALLRIAPYLQREVTFVHQILNPDFFEGPTTSEMDAIDALIAETKGALMSGCGMDDLIAVMEELRDCVCNLSTQQQTSAGSLPDTGGWEDDSSVTRDAPDDSWADYTPPLANAARCEMAQAIYWWWYDVQVNQIFPVLDQGADALTAAIVAASLFADIAVFAGIPVATLASMVVAAVNAGFGASISALTTWIFESKEEIVCAYYQALPDLKAASAAVKEFIDGETQLSFLERVMAKVFYCSTWHMSYIIKDQETKGTWNSYIDSGYCSVCDDPTTFYYIGEPYASATLVSSLNLGDCTAFNVANSVTTPNFVCTETGSYLIKANVTGSSTEGTMICDVYQVTAPGQVIATKTMSVGSSDDFEMSIDADLLDTYTYYVRWRNSGASDGRIEWCMISFVE